MPTPKKPSLIHKANGNPSKKTFAENEAKPEQPGADELAPPPGMSPRAKKAWRHIVEGLHRCGLYTIADENALRKYCEAFAEWEHAQRMVWKFGHVVGKDKDGNLVKFEGRHNIETFPKINPWFRVSGDAFNRCAKLIPQLGLSPASRSGLATIVPPKELGEGEFDEFDQD